MVRDGAPALHEKLNNYLIQSLDEKFATLYPEAAGKQVFIRVDLYAAPDAFIVEFLRRYSAMLVPYGAGFHAAVKGIEVA